MRANAVLETLRSRPDCPHSDPDRRVRRACRAGAASLVTALLLAPTAGAATHNLGALDQPPVPPAYQGLRVDRSWAFSGSWLAQDTLKTFGAPGSFANAPLPDNAALDAGLINGVPTNPATPNEIQRQASSYGTYLNRASFTAPITIVPADQPLTPVDCTYAGTACVSQMRYMMAGTNSAGADLHGGLPIPDDYVPADSSDTDAEAVFYQPDYISPAPAAYAGRFYEAWKLRPNAAFDPSLPVSPSNPKWTAGSGGRVVGVATSPGHYRNWTASGYQYSNPGHPDSTYQGATWGVLAGGTWIGSDEVSREDCKLGRIDHEVGLLMHSTKPAHVWPAQRHDGSQPSWNVMEGQRFRFPPGMAKPAFSNRLAGMLFDAAQKYGLVVDDNTNASVGIRVEPLRNGVSAPECDALLDGVAGYSALAQFPWSRLQVLAVGSDANPTPTN